MQVSTNSPVLDAKLLAEYLRISRRTLESIVLSGEGPPFLKLGRQRRWRVVDVDAWIQARVQATGYPVKADDERPRHTSQGAQA